MYDSRSNCNAIIETATNSLLAGCSNTVIPDEVTSIGEAAFSDCGIVSVDIPKGVTEIGEQAFCNCTQLKAVVSRIAEPFDIPGNTFSVSIAKPLIYSSATLYVPVGTKEKYESTYAWSLFENIVEGEPAGIKGVKAESGNQPQDVYDLRGNKVRSKAASLDGLPQGVYIVNGKKVVK